MDQFFHHKTYYYMVYYLAMVLYHNVHYFMLYHLTIYIEKNEYAKKLSDNLPPSYIGI